MKISKLLVHDRIQIGGVCIQNGKTYESFIYRQAGCVAKMEELMSVFKISTIQIGGVCSKMEERKSSLKILTTRNTKKKPLRRPRLRWESNIRILQVNTS